MTLQHCTRCIYRIVFGLGRPRPEPPPKSSSYFFLSFLKMASLATTTTEEEVDNTQYKRKAYWDERFQTEDNYEWLCGFKDVEQYLNKNVTRVEFAHFL